VNACPAFLLLYKQYKLPATVQVVTAGWQGSRGDARLLARLGLSQAGLQDEKDALEKALAAKNRWRRKSSSKGWLREPGASIAVPAGQSGNMAMATTVHFLLSGHLCENTDVLEVKNTEALGVKKSNLPAFPVLCESLLDMLYQGQLNGTAHSRLKAGESRSASWLCC